MLLTMLALTIAAPECRANLVPRELSGWTRTGEGLDTRHAITLRARGGMAETRVRIRKAGIFGIAIDRDGWIDVAPARGKALRMASENRGPRCSGIRKIVRYRLRPGEYRVTVAKLQADRVRMLLVHGEPR